MISPNENERECFFRIVRDIYDHYSLIFRTNSSTLRLQKFYNRLLAQPNQVDLKYINRFLVSIGVIVMQEGLVTFVSNAFPIISDLSRRYTIFLKKQENNSTILWSSIVSDYEPVSSEEIYRKAKHGLQPLGFFSNANNIFMVPENFAANQKKYRFDIRKWPRNEVKDAIKIMWHVYSSKRPGMLTIRTIFASAGLSRFHPNPREARYIVEYFNIQLHNLGLIEANNATLKSIIVKNNTPPSDEELEKLLNDLSSRTNDISSEKSVKTAPAVATTSKMSITHLVHSENSITLGFDDYPVIGERPVPF